MNTPSSRRILGIDPGYGIVGWGIIDQQQSSLRYRAHGTITTPAAFPFPERLRTIYTELVKLFEEYSPTLMGVEKLYFEKNVKTAIDVSQARGVILLSATLHNIALVEYTPLQVKQSVTGFGKADKAQVQRMVKSILKLSEIPKPDDAADALALAICSSQHRI